MASIKRSISTKRNPDRESEILLRVNISPSTKWRVKSGVFLPAERLDNGKIIMPRGNPIERLRLQEVESRLTEVESLLINHCNEARDPNGITKDELTEIVERYHHPERFTEQRETSKSFFDLWEEFTSHRDISKNRSDTYRSLARALHRFETHRRVTGDLDYALDVDTLTAEDLARFERFYRDEWMIYDEYPDIYLEYPAELRTQHKTHRPQMRGNNIVVNVMKKIATFFKWCHNQGLTENRPFDRYKGKSERYGTPYYLTIEERDRLAEHDFGPRKTLAVQRDIFIFQCLIGCRVSDLTRLRKDNIVEGAVEYIAEKTKKERSNVIRVPLNSRACAILDRYKDIEGEQLLPFISHQRYNDAIKTMCKLAGIDRVVTVLNPTTGEDERRPIYEIASSHLARRTFIGNLYKRVKDPNLVGSLSGHKEGSKAFARYRDIDDDIKKELVDLLD